MITIFVDREDRLHVRDGGFRWSVFSPEQEFLRSASAPLASFQSGTAVLDIGMAVTRSRDGENHFQIVDSAGATQRAFGVIPRSLRRARVDTGRDITYAGGDSFWAGPIAGSPDGYQLEEWGIDGKLRRVFRRNVDWFPPGDPTRLSDGDPPPTQVSLLHLDDSGLLYVYGLGPTRHWRSPGSLGRAPTTEEMDRMAQGYVEVIDTKSGRLLASERNLTRTQSLARFPHGFFSGFEGGLQVQAGGHLRLLLVAPRTRGGRRSRGPSSVGGNRLRRAGRQVKEHLSSVARGVSDTPQVPKSPVRAHLPLDKTSRQHPRVLVDSRTRSGDFSSRFLPIPRSSAGRADGC